MTLSEEVTGDRSDFLLAIARDQAGTIGGFIRIVPTYGEDPGYTLDLMRHTPGSPIGGVEGLVNLPFVGKLVGKYFVPQMLDQSPGDVLTTSGPEEQLS